jgi:hypothetical protein
MPVHVPANMHSADRVLICILSVHLRRHQLPQFVVSNGRINMVDELGNLSTVVSSSNAPSKLLKQRTT